MARTCCANSKPKTAEFKFHAPMAKKVSLVGSFNNWNTKGTSAKKDAQGNWLIKVNLKPGRYEYKFLVDGNWINDPSNRAMTTNSFGTQNNILEIK